MIEQKKITKPMTKVSSLVETIYGCKWSLTVYSLLRSGVKRPGAMVRNVEGLSTKVLNSCLKKNVDFGILSKKTFPEVPPRVEYEITPFGQNFMVILDEIEQLNQKLEQGLL